MIVQRKVCTRHKQSYAQQTLSIAQSTHHTNPVLQPVSILAFAVDRQRTAMALVDSYNFIAYGQRALRLE